MDVKLLGSLGGLLAFNAGAIGVTLKWWPKVAQKGQKAPEMAPPEPDPIPDRPVVAPTPAPSAVNPFADLHHKLVALIREGRGMRLHADTGGWGELDQWYQRVMVVLHEDGYWMPEIQELQLLADVWYEKPQRRSLTPSQILAREIRALESFAWRLHRQEVI